MTTSKLESPLVNIINPPSLPDPAGLGPLYTAIANGNMFRDMSGMAQSSSLLQTALQAAQSAAANAASNSGEAQKVAANQLTDILKIAAQIVAGAMGIPTGAIGGGSNSTSSGTHNLPPTPSNKGANINAAKELDAKKRAAANQNNQANNSSPDEWTPFTGAANPNDGLTPPPLVSADETGDAYQNETTALNGPSVPTSTFIGNQQFAPDGGINSPAGEEGNTFRKAKVMVTKKEITTGLVVSYPVPNGKKYIVPIYECNIEGEDSDGNFLRETFNCIRFGVYLDPDKGIISPQVVGLRKEQSYPIKWQYMKSMRENAWHLQKGDSGWYIHRGSTDPQNVGWGAIGCVEITEIDGWKNFNGTLLNFTGVSKIEEINSNSLVDVYFEEVTSFPPLTEETP